MVLTVQPLLWKTGGGFLSFVILVGDHRDLWIEFHEIMILGFWKHDIIHPMTQYLHLEDPSTINRFNDTLHTSFFKYDIYLKGHCLYNRAISPLPTHLA